MDPDRWQQVQALFDQALPLPEDERQAFLEDACRGDADLLQEVHTLLTADEDGAGFFEEALQEGLDLFQAAQESSPTPTRFGKYEVVGEVGEGGFGKVYRGRDPQLERAVAIKTCGARDPLLRQRFVREARIAAGLQHPKIVTVHDFGEEAGLPFLVQELLEGEDLDRQSPRGEVLTLAAKVEVLLQIAQGMAYAHQQGVLHRDIKPGNIRLLDDGQIKIMDFGIACLLHEEQRLTGEHMTVGTIGYIAPEQLTGSPLDERSDVFSFGVLAYELLAGQRPFQGEVYAEVSDQILHHEPPPLRRLARQVPGALADCIQRCLAKEPEARPAGFAEIVDRLEAVVAKGGSSARVWRWGGIAAGFALATLLTAWMLWPNPPLSRSEPVPPTPQEAEVSRPGPPKEATVADGARPASSASAVPAQAASQPRSPSPSATEGAPSDEPVAAGPIIEPTTESAAAPPEPQAPTSHELPGQAQEPPVPTEPTHADTTRAVEPTPPADGDRIAQQNPARPDIQPPENLLAEPPAGSEGRVTPVAEPPTPVAGATDPVADADTSASEPAPATRPMLLSLKPALLEHPQPIYPALARHRRQEAQVTLAVLVDGQGKVLRALVTRSNDPGLGFDEAARQAALAASFHPAIRDGKPIQEWAELTIEFRLP